MTDNLQEVRETTTRSGNTLQKTTEVREPGVNAEYRQSVAERIIWYITGVLLVLLAFRFVLSLLGANRGNGFADFIYSASQPFVSPFFSLFSYNYDYGVARFELYTLVAMAVYAVVAYGLARLVTLNRPVAR
jgi:hypothetical protein